MTERMIAPLYPPPLPVQTQPAVYVLTLVSEILSAGQTVVFRDNTFGPAKPANPGSPGSQSHSVGPSSPSAASPPDSSEESVSGPAGGYSYGT